MKKNDTRKNNSHVPTQRMSKSHFHSPSHVVHGSSSGVFIPTCHYCGRKSHIRWNCFQFKKWITTQSLSEESKSKGVSLHFHGVPPVQRHPPMHHFPPRISFILVCHHCKRRGHIRPRCIDLRKLSIQDNFQVRVN